MENDFSSLHLCLFNIFNSSKRWVRNNRSLLTDHHKLQRLLQKIKTRKRKTKTSQLKNLTWCTKIATTIRIWWLIKGILHLFHLGLKEEIMAAIIEFNSISTNRRLLISKLKILISIKLLMPIRQYPGLVMLLCIVWCFLSTNPQALSLTLKSSQRRCRTKTGTKLNFTLMLWRVPQATSVHLSCTTHATTCRRRT